MEVDSKSLSVVLGGLLGISEIMALVPGLKSNGILHFIINVLKDLTQA